MDRIDGGSDSTKPGQCWMRENLRYFPININNATGTDVFCKPDINECNNYRAYYTWATTYSFDLCPKGWHVSTDNDWLKLEESLNLLPEDLYLIRYPGVDEYVDNETFTRITEREKANGLVRIAIPDT